MMASDYRNTLLATKGGHIDHYFPTGTEACAPLPLPLTPNPL